MTVVVFFCGGTARAIQTVWVDFDTYTTPEIGGEEDDYEYSPAERTAVLDILNSLFFTSPDDPTGGEFGITFLDSEPPPFTATLVKVNASLGHSEKIDFRNLDDDDDVDIHPVRTLKLFEGTTKPGGGAWTESELLTSENIVMATANLAAHELGHSFGLRHHDAFTPIGAGIGVDGTKYTPTYVGPGPGGGNNSSFHIMGLNSSVALNAVTVTTPSWFSPRSALKMTLNRIEDEIGDNPLVASEGDFGGDAPDSPMPGVAPIPFMSFPIRNTTQPPDPGGIDPTDPMAPSGPELFPAGVGVVTGRLEDKSDDMTVDLDYYSFFGMEGQRATVEVISHILSLGDGRITDPVDPHVELLDATLFPLPYPAASVVGMAALNDDQFESTDSILFDVVLPYTGEYFVEVRPAMKPPMEADVVGDYELLVYTIDERAAVPEPASLALGALGALAVTLLRVRRMSFRR